ncbi:MAG: hypothetical protein FJ098_04555 [Deltaproteobacteria bacterium]|nr:hypothetical protein [Deltaproteobacteria bacterium]
MTTTEQEVRKAATIAAYVMRTTPDPQGEAKVAALAQQMKGHADGVLAAVREAFAAASKSGAIAQITCRTVTELYLARAGVMEFLERKVYKGLSLQPAMSTPTWFELSNGSVIALRLPPADADGRGNGKGKGKTP